MSSVHILLVVNELEWRDQLWVSLSVHNDLQMIGAVCNKEEALEQFTSADVIIMDGDIEGIPMEGLKLARQMNQIHPAKIIMLTDRCDMDSMLNGLLAGVRRFVSKADYAELPRVIREITVNQYKSGLSTA